MPFAHPLYIMAKPAGPLCNLRCGYCYYLEKRHLRPAGAVMTDATLEAFVSQYIAAQTTADVLFTWHGGEPLMRPLAFYRRALQLQRQYGRGRRVANCLQTNGTLLTAEWCEFLRDNHFLVGISIDGPQDMHDRYRLTATRRPSHRQVMRGIEMLDRYGVEWNAMAVVTRESMERPQDFYRFFRSIGCHYLQFTPIVERTTTGRTDGLTLMPGMSEGGEMAPYSVTPEGWGRFLTGVFDEWIHGDVGEYFVQLFDATLAGWVGQQPGICTMAAECGHAGVMEADGDVYSCDHFVYPEYRLGNIHEHTLLEMMYSGQQREFAAMKRRRLPRQCEECEYLKACHGECPKNRFVRDRYGNPGLNYLCPGYHAFFSHVAPYMDLMRVALAEGRSPAEAVNRLEK